MKLTELKYIVALEKTKHFGKAAKMCHVSQPTISLGISNLEKKLKTNLFERHRHAVYVTPMGEKIISQAKIILADVENIQNMAKNAHSQITQPLKVGAIHTVGPYLFPTLIPCLKKTAPNMPLHIEEEKTDILIKKLSNGELDVIFTALPININHTLTRPLYDEPFVVLFKKTHPFNKKDSISNLDLKKEKVLLLGEGHCLRDQIIQSCPACYSNDPAQQPISGISLETLRHMVASGLGITILPSTATQVRHYRQILSTKPFKSKTPKRTIALTWRENFTRPKAIGSLLKALTQAKLHGTCILPDLINDTVD